MIPSLSFSKSIEMIYFNFVFFNISTYFCEHIIASAFDLSIKLSNSFSGNDLSNGTTVPVPQTIDKYAISHSYLFSPITAILLSFNPISINFVPSPSTIFLTSLCVISLYPFSCLILYAIFSPYFSPDFFSISFKSVISIYLYNLSILFPYFLNFDFVCKPYIFIPFFRCFLIILGGQYKLHILYFQISIVS